MAVVHRKVETPWDAGSTVHAKTAIPWGAGSTVHATPSAYTPGPPPVGGTPTCPVPAVPAAVIPAQATYDVAHSMTVRDYDGQALPVESLSLGADVDSPVWTLQGSGGADLFMRLTGGPQPPLVEVDLDGETWAFVVDTVSRTRALAGTTCDFAGRSLAVMAGEPYAGSQNWVNDGDTTGAQITAIANLYSGLLIQWEIDDWLIPDRVFSHTGTPLSVVSRVAEAAGAVVLPDRNTPAVRVVPRYPVMPDNWAATLPDVAVAIDAALSERFERADSPEYTGVYVSGMQQGAVGFVRLAGSSGSNLHPMVTDALLTEEPALRQRGQAILGESGGRAMVTLELPVLPGVGVLSVGQLVRVIDPIAPWSGLVRSVRVQAELPTIRQAVVLERHTKPAATGGLMFAGPIPTQYWTTGDPIDPLDLSPYWTGGAAPLTWAVVDGLPAGLTLDQATGMLTGTPTTWPGTYLTITYRASDAFGTSAIGTGQVVLGLPG